MYKKALALNNLQWVICYQTKPNKMTNYNVALLHVNHFAMGSE